MSGGLSYSGWDEANVECGMRNVTTNVASRTTFPFNSAFRTPHSALEHDPHPHARTAPLRCHRQLRPPKRNIPRIVGPMPQVGEKQAGAREQAHLAEQQAHPGPAVVVDRGLVQLLRGGVTVAAVRGERAVG